MPATTHELVYEARCRVASMTAEETELAMSLGALLVDVREANERERSGNIPGSLHVPRGTIELHADVHSPYYMAEFNPHAPVIVYCAESARAALAAETLQRMGYRDVSYLDGGFPAWAGSGKRIERVLASVDPGGPSSIGAAR